MELRSRLTKHGSYIDGLINIVPPNFYFPPDPDEVAKKYQKYTKGGKEPVTPKLDQIARKKARLNPEQSGVTEQIKAAGKAAGSDEDDDDDDDDDDEEEDEDDASDEEEEAAPPKQQGGRGGTLNKKPPPPVEPKPIPTLDAAGRLEGSTVDDGDVDGLRERLAARLKEMRGSRGGTPKAPGERAAEAKAKGKQPKHVSARRDAKASEARDGPSGGAAAASGAGAAGSSTSAIEFNKIAAAGAGGAKKRKMSTAALLAQAEEKERKKRERLNSPDGGGEDVGIGEWQRALEKAGGIKQRDNPTLLRKALKKKEKAKKKSAKEWGARAKTVAKNMQEKQEKRKTNLAERKTKNKVRASKHKAARAGFEGKKGLL